MKSKNNAKPQKLEIIYTDNSGKKIHKELEYYRLIEREIIKMGDVKVKEIIISYNEYKHEIHWKANGFYKQIHTRREYARNTNCKYKSASR